MMRITHALLRDTRGSSAIETAFVAPILILMSLGSYQASEVVARQHELDTGADQATALVLAGWSDTVEQRAALQQVVQESLGVTGEQIELETKYRCGTATAYVDSSETCAEDAIVATFLRLELTDTYTPTWTQFGIGSAINLSVERMVQLS
jgi:Flp pilus assembly protein TadG